MPAQPERSTAHLQDSDLAVRIGRGDERAFESMMRRHNSKLFRIARAILKDDAEAEDALQDAYLDAFRRMADFRGASRLDTWLTRIVINRALMRLRKQRRDRVVVSFSGRDSEGADIAIDPPDERAESPTDRTFRAEIRRLLERRIDELPIAFRTVFVMREVEDMSVDETAECLAIPATTVRTRLFRARALLREALARDLDSARLDVFGFAGDRCDRIVGRVLARLAAATPTASETPVADA